MKRVHCMGVLVVDALSGPIPHYPVPGTTTQVNTDTVTFMPGGGVANVSSALCNMGIPATVFSKIGDDPTGALLMQELSGRGVDTAGVRISKSDPTPFTFVGMHPDGERTFIHTPGANKTFSASDINRDELFDTDYLLYDDLWVMPRLDGEPGAELLREARSREVVTLLDECWGLGPVRETFELMVPHVDYLLPSYHDLQAIYPGKAPEEVTTVLHDLGAKVVVLKMGKNGCLLSRDGKRERFPSAATEIVDSTGAGDAFVAGFIGGLVHGCGHRRSTLIGSQAAAACIRHVGGSSGIPPFERLLRSAVGNEGV